MTRIAIVGAGAVGGTIAAWLDAGGHHDLVLCTRRSIDELQVETPSGPLVMRARNLTDPILARPVDWVLLATKTYDSAGAHAWLRGLVGPSTHVAILQNGVEHRVPFTGLIPDARLVPVIVDLPAERTAPGRIHQRRMGSLLVPQTDAGTAFATLFSDTPITVGTTAHFTSAAWRKLAVNCAGAVNALTLQPASIAHDPGAADLMRGLVAECIAVGRAEGAVLPDALVEEVVAGYRNGPADGINSLHADRLAGRRMEWDARNGVIVRFGEGHGIATPLNRMAATLLRVMQ